MNDTTLEHVLQNALALLQDIRQQVYAWFTRARDALFNLTDALLSESPAHSLPEWSLSAFVERKWSSVDEALEDGCIDLEQLRAVWVKALLSQKRQDEPVGIAVDACGIERAEAVTSQDRGIIHLSNLPLLDKPIGVGWMFSTVTLLPEKASSWAPILDQQRIPTEHPPIQVAIAQLQALNALLGKRRVIVVADRGYCTPTFLRACHDLGYSCLVRLKSDRRLYGPGIRLHPKGPAPQDGALFAGETQRDPWNPGGRLGGAGCQRKNRAPQSFQPLAFQAGP